MTRVFDFNDQLLMSEGHAEVASVERVLCDLIPGAMSVTKACTENDRSGTDWWVEISNRHLSVDAKVREQDWAATHPSEDDLALETFSVKGYQRPDGSRTRDPRVVGWTRNPDKRADYILWIWKDTQRHCLIAFPNLCRVFQDNWVDWSRKFKTCEQYTRQPKHDRDGWFSECVFVPRRLIWGEIYKTFSPNP